MHIVTASAQHGADVNASNADGRTALHIATSSNAVAVVDALIAAKADVDAQASGGQEALLHVATGLGHSEVAVTLSGGSALHIAASDIDSTAIVGSRPCCRR